MTEPHDYTRYYNRWHDEDPLQRKKASSHYYPYIRNLEIPKQARVLDVGCGQGLFVEAMNNNGYEHVVGIDTSREQINVAQKYMANCFHVDDIQTWTLSNQNYDFIFLFDVLEHVSVSDQIEFLSEIRRSLSHTGKIFIRVPNANATFASRFRWGDWTHHCAFTEHSIDYVLFASGFNKIDVIEDHFGRLPIWIPRPNLPSVLRLITRIGRRMSAIGDLGPRAGWAAPLTNNLVAIASV